MTREALSEQYHRNNQALQRAWRQHFMQHMQQSGALSPPQWWLLKSIRERGSMSGRELASHLEVSRSAITQMLDGLEQYIVRKTDEQDRRVVHISLSEAGKACLEEFDTEMRRYSAEGISALDDSELAVLVRAQAKILDHLGATR